MHWRVPLVLTTAFIAGIAFAIGHHFFYRSLDGSIVDQHAFDQQINIGIGTAFAFLVRATLVISVGTAFVQVLWRILLTESLTIASIDSLSQLRSSLWDLLNVKLLWKHPVLAFLAIVSWLLPLAVIVPPSTLTVQTPIEPRQNAALRNLPFVDFDTMNMVKVYSANVEDGDQLQPNQVEKDYHGGSSDDLTQLAFGVALQGDIATITPPALNLSYTSNFYAPSIQCSQANTSMIAGFDQRFGCELYDQSLNSTNRCGFNYTYIAWVPIEFSRVDLDASEGSGTIDFTPNYDGSGYGLTTSGAYQDEPTSLYIATVNDDDDMWSLLNCSLYNSSYTVAFNYSDGNQTLKSSHTPLNSLPFINLVSETMLANISGYPPAGSLAYEAPHNSSSFQAVMDSFGQIMVGGIMYAISRTGGGDNIMATSILKTRLRQCLTTQSQDQDLNACPSLARAAEELFQNITLSLFSKNNFTTIDSARSPATNVTLYNYPNIYQYTWQRLVLSYGLAILFALVAVIIGALSLLRSGQSYDHTFSTIVRTTRSKELDELIEPKDRDGRDPLPEYIADANVRVGEASGARLSQVRELGSTATSLRKPYTYQTVSDADHSPPLSASTHQPLPMQEHNHSPHSSSAHQHARQLSVRSSISSISGPSQEPHRT